MKENFLKRNAEQERYKHRVCDVTVIQLKRVEGIDEIIKKMVGNPANETRIIYHRYLLE